MTNKIPACTLLPPHNSGGVRRITLCPLAPWLFLLGIGLMILLGGCGDTISKPRRDRAAKALSSVIVSVQLSRDSTRRVRLADSAARVHGFDGWLDLKDELEEIAVFPEHMREL